MVSLCWEPLEEAMQGPEPVCSPAPTIPHLAQALPQVTGLLPEKENKCLTLAKIFHLLRHWEPERWGSSEAILAQ